MLNVTNSYFSNNANELYDDSAIIAIEKIDYVNLDNNYFSNNYAVENSAGIPSCVKVKRL